MPRYFTFVDFLKIKLKTNTTIDLGEWFYIKEKRLH